MNSFMFLSHAAAIPAIAILLPFLPVILFWSIFWKGIGLWHAGRRAHAWWFVILLVVNTVGILEIIYLFGVLRLRLSELFSSKTE